MNCIIRVKQNTQTLNIPIIFLTAAFKDKENIVKGYDHGGIDYITKPTDSDILIKKINAVLSVTQSNKKLIKLLKRTSLY